MRESEKKLISERDNFFQSNKSKLERLAYRAINIHKKEASEFLVICIDVDDSTWTGVVDALMPNEDWNRYRNRGEKPVALGSIPMFWTDYISKVVPDVAQCFKKELPKGMVFGVVLASKGASVYYVDPAQHLESN
jgi:hypothetical protein